MEGITETQVLQVIGQLEASINKVEPYLDIEEFKDYCDSTYSSIAVWRSILYKIRESSKK